MSEVKKFTCERPNGNIAQTGLLPLFVVSDYIRVHAVIGIVTETAIQAQANAAKLVANPTVGDDVDLCATLETNGKTVGTIFTVTGDFTDAMVTAASGAVTALGFERPFIVAPGTIDMHCANSNTGKVAWTLVWSPVKANASVRPA